MSSVKCVYLNKTYMEIELNTYAIVFAHSTPLNSNETIRWKTNNTNIVSLDECTGQIKAIGVGDAYITVYLESDPTIYDICHVKVKEKGGIPVTSISFPVTELTLLEGKTMTLGVVVEPSNASNKNISWRSCCPEIATVSSNGTIRAIKPGVVEIYATTEDRSLTAKCTIRVVIDEVIVRKNNLDTELFFKSTGKTWKCLFTDMVFDDSNVSNSILINRNNNNLYNDLNENNKDLRIYSNEALNLIYRIDPLGLAYYVQTYASLKYSGDLMGQINYKDNIFRILFKREPLYFRRKNLEEWEITEKNGNPSTFVSESETIFGAHPIYDHITKAQLISLALDVAWFAIGIGITLKGQSIPIGLNILVSTSINIAKNALLNSVNIETSTILDAVVPSQGLNAYKDTDLNWAGDIISAYGDLYDIITTTINSIPNFNNNIIDYCDNSIPIQVEFNLSSGKIITLHKLNEELKKHS